ncbi:uncharacterized protein LOC126878649 [Diabrotica virgifera virgifera]|uniref:CCHC-type domain-containing protein n=1 Tax=Diabrotica virgifera virgifera TaxID=50390 RepID=A0ABM5JHM7_DIAVI|nr:uncharacterized protein LOC126878649 [Diabrotica virgifera virgifera]
MLAPRHKNNINLIERELCALKNKFQNDQIMLTEVNNLSSRIENISRRKVEYKDTDFGPFLIMIESDKGKAGNIHPMDIGKVFHTMGTTGIKEISRKGMNRIGVIFNTSKQANMVLNSTEILEKGFLAYIPQKMLTSRGIIRDVSINISMENIVNDSKLQKNVKIISARRLNRRVLDSSGTVTYIPTGTVQLLFDVRTPPKEIIIYSNLVTVDPYIPPVQQCFKCLRFGHSQRQCRGKARCPKCSDEHTVQSCTVSVPKCLYCDLDHLATNKICKEFERQKKINEVMVFQDLTFFEAAKLFPPIKEKPENSRMFQRRSRDFPSLLSSSPRAFTQALQKSPSSTPHFQSQSHVVPVKRKNKVILKDISYDKEAHKALLNEDLSRNLPRLPILNKLNDSQKYTGSQGPSFALSLTRNRVHSQDSVFSKNVDLTSDNNMEFAGFDESHNTSNFSKSSVD